MSVPDAGITLPGVPDPERQRRRRQAHILRDQGFTYQEIADRLGVQWWTIQDDLRPTPKPAPLSIRFPGDVVDRARTAAGRMGVTLSQFVVESVRQRLEHQDRNRERQRHLRGGGEDPDPDA